MNKKNVKRGLLPYVFLLLIILTMYYLFGVMNSKVNELTYDAFIKELEKGTVTELKITPRESYGVYDMSGKLKGYEERTRQGISGIWHKTARLASDSRTMRETWAGRGMAEGASAKALPWGQGGPDR